MPASKQNEFVIADPRSHSEETLQRLQRLLASGAAGKPDPKRPDFHEVESGSEVFYLHVSPLTGTITLLATWSKEEAPALPDAAPARAMACCGETPCMA
jgi:hypothetical protein